MAELGDFLTQGRRTSKEITVEMLDYEYVNKCDSPEELRAILEMLRSGKEGIYPHLIEHTEKRLLAVLPDKERKKALSMRQEPSQGDIAEATHDLSGWVDSMRSARATAPKIGGTTTAAGAIFDESSGEAARAPAPRSKLPPPRNLKQDGARQHGWKNEEKFALATSTTPAESAGSDKQRISGYDFRSWDLYDVDAECEKLEMSERAAAEAKKEATEAAQRAAADRVERAHARRSAELAELRTSLEYEQRSPKEREFLAAHEKQKGNECYKAGEADEAYIHYSRSLALVESSAVVYANRAMACIKLGRLEQAEMDCTRALQIDPKYSKAVSRRGMTLHRRGRYREAMADFEAALELTPDDHALSELLRQSRAKFHEVSGVKLKIEEIGDGPGAQHIAVRAAVPKALPQGWTRTEPGTTKFTRIAIDGDDDDDDDDEVQTVDCANGASDASACTSAELKQRGVECCARGDYMSARTHFTAALDALTASASATERTPLLNNLAACAMATHDYEAVIEHTSAVLSGDAQNAKALLRRGAALEKRGLYAEACADMETLVAMDGTLVDARSALERLRALVSPPGQTTAADDERVGDNSRAAHAESLKNKGNEAMKAGDHLGAIDVYARALELDSSNLAARNNRAFALLKLGRHEEAEREASVVLAREPKNPKALYRRGAARRARGVTVLSSDAASSVRSFQQALTDFEALRRMEPNNAQANAEHAATESDLLRAQACLLEVSKSRGPPAAPDDTAESRETPATAATGMRITIEEDDDDDAVTKVHIDTIENEHDEHSGQVARITIEESDAEDEGNTAKGVARITIEEESDEDERTAAEGVARITIEEESDEEDERTAAEGVARITIEEESDAEDEGTAAEGVARISIEEDDDDVPTAGGGATRIAIDEDDDDATPAETSTLSPALSKSERSLAAKEEGVAAIGRGDLQAALESFTRAIDLDSANVAARNNRALVHLRLGQYDLAVGDASAVLAVEPQNTKALFRRGTARKAMASALVADAAGGQPGPLADAALADLDAALAIEPTNTHAQRERSAVVAMRTELQQQRVSRARVPEPPRRAKVRAKAIPTAPPKTQYELERVWRDLKNDPGALAQYIQTFKASTYKKVLKESLNEDVLSGMLGAASEHLSSDAAARMLQGIAQSSGFAMWRMMMSEGDKARVRELIERARRDGVPGDEIATAYGVQ